METKENLAPYIDHTVLKAFAKKEDIAKVCKEALSHHFASVCINPCWVPFAAKLLRGSDVKVCTVIGFPLGANASETKAFETKKAVADGAQEIDMVINIGALKDGDFITVAEDIKAVREQCKSLILKVIIETSYLTDEEKTEVCKIAAREGADFVKTSTGFSDKGATAQDVALMARASGIKVKASGGVRSKEDAKAMIEAGASRLGTSAGVKIVEG